MSFLLTCIHLNRVELHVKIRSLNKNEADLLKKYSKTISYKNLQTFLYGRMLLLLYFYFLRYALCFFGHKSQTSNMSIKPMPQYKARTIIHGIFFHPTKPYFFDEMNVGSHITSSKQTKTF